MYRSFRQGRNPILGTKNILNPIVKYHVICGDYEMGLILIYVSFEMVSLAKTGD